MNMNNDAGYEDFELYDIPNYNGKYKANKNGDIFYTKLNKYLAYSYDPKGYYIVKLDGVTKRVHRLIAKTFLNNINNLPMVDHINRDKKDNRLINLRYVNASINGLNKETIGVYQFPNGRFYSKCQSKYLGSFDNFEDAKNCYVNYKNNIINNFLIENEILGNNFN